jgi:ribosomal protein S18 acetylase RimI-like enzyme
VEPEPRRAHPNDAAAIRTLVRAAFAKYVPRMGREPAPMLADYTEPIETGRVWVLEDGGTLVGVLVGVPRADHLYVDTVAVSPDAGGRGLGRLLLERAERDAVELGLPEVRLSTNEAMTENIAYYPRRGYAVTGRGIEDGYQRVFFTKRVTTS